MIRSPRRQEEYADREIDCQEAMDPGFQAIVDCMLEAGRTRGEIMRSLRRLIALGHHEPTIWTTYTPATDRSLSAVRRLRRRRELAEQLAIIAIGSRSNPKQEVGKRPAEGAKGQNSISRRSTMAGMG
ncbi:MAG: hypothetical protein E5V72_02895 [Mesorhizobium sp.]|nr:MULTISPECIES: hypothetical protein [unclassified Mesorhizobium]RUV81964.1 hypothetical protein EOA88_19195 [Mesorhizobium sp. M5C.F.Ca.IN.020.14.1.1]RUV30166.1 hypothetical protein EOA86_12260 [Mesorhizobium sp. M5C.F.Ca.IN.020.32.2.1]RWC38928.1 MAG: hypothetical protein EOS28_28600 [Mesorhizobium sp.]RWD39981.1 MAG: hypothetical protein EOS59_31340 [Mesorhizobium sp.]RWE51291.1 MAG: hypothetical protein EOS24_33395 [Mesorhizobium sp.]